MGKHGSFYKGENKKKKKKDLEKIGSSNIGRDTFILPQVEIIKKGKNDS